MKKLIVISEETKKTLDDSKLVPCETYESVMQRILKKKQVNVVGRDRIYPDDGGASKQAAYISRLKDKEEKLRQLKLSFDNYLDEQVSIEDSKRELDRTKCNWDAKVAYTEEQIKTNYQRAINREPLDFGMSYFQLYVHICKHSWTCMADNCDIINYRFEEHCIGCKSKRPSGF